jgi:hypothetical protein
MHDIYTTRGPLTPPHDAGTDLAAELLTDALRDDATVTTLPHVAELLKRPVSIVANSNDRQAFVVEIDNGSHGRTLFHVSVVRIAK